MAVEGRGTQEELVVELDHSKVAVAVAVAVVQNDQYIPGVVDLECQEVGYMVAAQVLNRLELEVEAAVAVAPRNN